MVYRHLKPGETQTIYSWFQYLPQLTSHIHAEHFQIPPSSSFPQVAVTSGLHDAEQHDVENHNADTVNEKKSGNANSEGSCKLMEAFMEVPIVAETDSITSSSQNSLTVQRKESPQNSSLPSPKAKATMGKQQRRRPERYNQKKLRPRWKIGIQTAAQVVCIDVLYTTVGKKKFPLGSGLGLLYFLHLGYVILGLRIYFLPKIQTRFQFVPFSLLKNVRHNTLEI